jgi:hypothetical protein
MERIMKNKKYVKKLVNSLLDILDDEDKFNYIDSEFPDIKHKDKNVSFNIPSIFDLIVGFSHTIIDDKRVILSYYDKLKINLKVRKVYHKMEQNWQKEKIKKAIDYIKNGDNNGKESKD